MPLPHEFIVQGIPRSQQTRLRSRLQAWKTRVSSLARQSWPNQDPDNATKISVYLCYFYTRDILDIDNIIKPILDSIIGIIITEDRYIEQIIARKSPISGLAFNNPTPAIASGMQTGADFVYFRIVDAGPNHASLPIMP